MPEPPEGPRALVVGAAVIQGGLLLAARRTTPPEAAGRWELPGGKVDPGETATHALIREIEEELGCTVAVGRWLEGAQPIGTSYVLRIAVCRVAVGSPRPGDDHDELRWLAPDELDDLDWLEPDRPFLPTLRPLLLGS
jgi:8-oxo-dGTP diphosphatase